MSRENVVEGRDGGERRFLGRRKNICKGLVGVEDWKIQETERRPAKRQRVEMSLKR